MKIVEGVKVPNVRIDFTAKDLLALRKNSMEKSTLVCGLGPDEYNRISKCTTNMKQVSQ